MKKKYEPTKEIEPTTFCSAVTITQANEPLGDSQLVTRGIKLVIFKFVYPYIESSMYLYQCSFSFQNGTLRVIDRKKHIFKLSQARSAFFIICVVYGDNDPLFSPSPSP